jgi:hypothetical protein
MNIKQEIEKYVDENDQIYLNDIDGIVVCM